MTWNACTACWQSFSLILLTLFYFILLPHYIWQTFICFLDQKTGGCKTLNAKLWMLIKNIFINYTVFPHLEIFTWVIIIHPPIHSFSSAYLIQGHGGSCAYPSCIVVLRKHNNENRLSTIMKVVNLWCRLHSHRVCKRFLGEARRRNTQPQGADITPDAHPEEGKKKSVPNHTCDSCPVTTPWETKGQLKVPADSV